MVNRKEAVEYFKKHNRPHPEIVAQQVKKYNDIMSKLPELKDEELKEPEPEPEE